MTLIDVRHTKCGKYKKKIGGDERKFLQINLKRASYYNCDFAKMAQGQCVSARIEEDLVVGMLL